jgi:hypothetical protein
VVDGVIETSGLPAGVVPVAAARPTVPVERSPA